MKHRSTPLDEFSLAPLVELRERELARDPDLIDLSGGLSGFPPQDCRRNGHKPIESDVTLSPYSPAEEELRRAIASWISRRFAVDVDVESELLPTLGAKAPMSQLPQIIGAPGDVAATYAPSYPIGIRSALLAGWDTKILPLSPDASWLPDPDLIDWNRVGLVWLISPHNPTGTIIPLELLAAFAERCRKYGAILAVDEVLSEYWTGDEPPPSALQLESRENIVVFNSLSKRSNAPGLRSGFAAGDKRVIAQLERFQLHFGTSLPAVAQRPSAAAWEDEMHVTLARAESVKARQALTKLVREAALDVVGGSGGIFLWLRTSTNADELVVEKLARRSLLMAPGSLFGPGGAGHLRATVVPLSPPAARRAGDALRCIRGACPSDLLQSSGAD